MARSRNDNGDAGSPKLRTIPIYRAQPESIEVRVVGITPLICHRKSEEILDQLEAKQMMKSYRRKTKDPEAEFQDALYVNEDGYYCFPACAFKQAMVSACRSIGDKTDFPMTKVMQAIFVEGNLLPLECETEPRRRRDLLPIGKGKTRTMDLRYRPEFKDWAITMIIGYNASVMSLEQVLALLEMAGYAVGVGDHRPERGGSSGRFKIDHKSVKIITSPTSNSKETTSPAAEPMK